MNSAAERNIIPRQPLLWLAAALLFLVPTMLGNLATWVSLLLLGTLLAKFALDRRDRRLRSLTWKVVLSAAGFGAVFLHYGSATGIVPGVSLLVVLASMKILESHTAREFHVMIMFAWVLCLCGFLLSQDFAIALCVLAAFVLLIAALVQFHRRSAAGPLLRAPLFMALKLLAQAMPLVVLLFFIFPRGTGMIQLRLPGKTSDSVGFSGQLSPGSVAEIATSDDLAFRAEFPDGRIPPRGALYWRGAVLWQGDGLNWDVGGGLGQARRSQRTGGVPFRQIITVQPHAGHWLFSLDRPIAAPAGVTLAPGRYLRSERPVTTMRRYEVTSAKDAGEDDLHARERTTALRLPTNVSSEIRDLVQSWTDTSDDPRMIVRAALDFFRTHGFVYSISPGQYTGAGALDDLLFHRKRGFCEHYAASFATLMRVAGVPSRVVVGYLGGQFNQYGNYLLVRQSDAHAWCEVWFPDSGWERVDPTGVIAPERLELGSLRAMQTAGAESAGNASKGGSSATSNTGSVIDNARLAWDTVSFAWDTRVLSFDLDAQRDFLAQLGADSVSGWSYLLWIGGGIVVLLALYAAWIVWRTRARPDTVKRFYEQFCRRAARAGAHRKAAEGPADFAGRAARLIPKQAQAIERISNRYIALRYSPDAEASAIDEFTSDVRAFANSREK